MTDLTAIILTKNEELNIRDCIESVKPLAKRILVVDSFSEDRTVEIAKEMGAETYRHVFETHAKQFLYALENLAIDTTWVLRIDADERLTPKSREELEMLCEKHMAADDEVTGVVLRFEVSFLGKKLRHGGIYPFRKLQLFKYGKATMEDRNMDEHIVLLEGKSIDAKEDCEHHDFKDLTFFVNKHNWYSTKEMQDFLERQRVDTKMDHKLDGKARLKRWVKFHIYYRLPMGMRAYIYYVYRYYLKMGFLDGKEGKIYAFLQAYWYRFLVDAKLYEYQQNEKTAQNNH